jgi:hypothetical protein
MTKTDKALQSIRTAKEAVAQELERHRVGTGTVSTPAQLLAIRDQLDVWQSEVERGSLTPRNQRNRGMGRMITDSWPLGSLLGQALLTAEESYASL